MLRASSLTALRAAARAGLGVAALPCLMADADPGLVRILPPVAEMATSLWLLTHPDLRRAGRIRAVMDGLARELTARRRLLEGGL